MSRRLRWEAEGRHWPLRETSSFLTAGNIAWHVQRMGNGPSILLLHGTGASAHSWRDVMPALADRFSVIAPDLPGHGFTSGQPRMGVGLDGMACAIEKLLASLELEPSLIVGHSAGAAIAINLAVRGGLRVPIIGFNPAIMPFPGAAARLFPAMAKVLFVNPFAPRIFAGMARVSGETGRFLYRSTGSRIDARGLHCYETLLGNARHCGGALAMMAQWDLEALARKLPMVQSPVLLVHSKHDKAIPLASVKEAGRLLPHCRLDAQSPLGHLAHEEDPDRAATLVADFALENGIGSDAEAAR